MKLWTVVLLLIVMNVLHAQLITYKAPEGSNLNNDFTVKVRQKGSGWQPVSVYLVKVANVVNGKKNIENSSLAYFDFKGNVEVAITSNKVIIKEIRIRPGNTVSNLVDNTLFFTLSNHQNLSVEINGDIFHNLQLFANPIEIYPPLSKDKNVLYFKPGIHKIDSLDIHSNQIIYLSGGAVVKGGFKLHHLQNVKLLGHGIINNSAGAIDIQNDKNIVVDGVIMYNSGNINIAESDSVVIRNIKSISFDRWGDGIDIYCSNHVLLEGIFMRNSDDCIAIYGHRNKWYGNTMNFEVKNATLWADVAHPVLIGTHGDPIHPDTLGNMVFTNIDILDQHEDQIDYQGCIALNAGDDNLIRNIRFENIRVGDIRKGQLVNLRVIFNPKYNTSAGRGIENVYFRNISYNGYKANMSVITGYDDTRSIKNVVFENLKINGKLIWDKMPDKPGWYKTGDKANILIGEHVKDISFIKTE